MPEPTTPILRIIYPVGRGWVVSANETENGFATLPSRSTAIRAVRAELKAWPAGGEIRVLNDQGKVVSRGFVAKSQIASTLVPGAVAVAPANPQIPIARVFGSPANTATPNSADQVRNAVKWSFKGYNWAFTVLGVFAPGAFAILTSEAIRSGFGSPTVVFITTFAWSAGVAAAFWWISSHKLTGWSAAGAAVLCLLAASLVANTIGLVSLSPGTGAGNPLEVIGLFAQSAMQTYGIGGFLAGTGAGLYFGWEISRWYEAHA